MCAKTPTRLANLFSLVLMLEGSLAEADVAPPQIGPDAIGGTVSSSAGAEAGVWVIAETEDLVNRFVKIVVTDDEGRFVLPQLPQATYRVWARGYGLIDSAAIEAVPGSTVALKPSVAPDAREAAQIYPASHWLSLIRVPNAEKFPGTGPNGNQINPGFETQDQWVAHLKENCQFCHQLGDAATRVLPDIGDPIQAWQMRILKSRGPDDPFFEGDITHQKRHFGERMTDLMTQFGGQEGLKMFADWTTRIAEGEAPVAPARPVGIERNLVITTWDIGDGRFMHDSISSDKVNPTVNANGPVYGFATYSGMVVSVDPNTGEKQDFKLLDRKGEYAKNSLPHTATMDSSGRVWVTLLAPQGENASFCTDPENKFAAYFPRQYPVGHDMTYLDPKTGKNEMIPVCTGTHHLNFDRNGRLYFSGDTEAVGWIDTEVWDKTRDAAAAVGWCPFVLDTNGDGKITPDRSQWSEQLAGIFGGETASLREEEFAGSVKATNDGKDTRIAGFNYGMSVNLQDQTYWGTKYSPIYPSGILRVDPGDNPPETCITEYYEAPIVDGEYAAFNARGVDVDANGVAWVAFGSGAIGRFDRSKCEVLNGPTATGQHCPEGWEIIPTPGPKLQGTDVGSDWFYVAFVDHDNSLGLGRGIPVFPNSTGDELLAYQPDEKKFVHLRVPYPLDFYARGLDGRIDDPDGDWKGRGLWSTSNTVPVWHQETGEGSSQYAAHFQLRPDPLAH